MTSWKDVLKADPTPWLLEPDNPSVRYLTLLNILNQKHTDHEVKAAKAAIMESGVIPRILAKQREGGWGDEGRFYRDKYRGTVWQLIILAEHEADGRDPRVRAACESILQHSQDPDSYAFAYDERAGGLGGRHSEVIPCLTGNMIWSLAKLGYRKERRVVEGIKWIARYQRFDDGKGQPPKEWPYERFEMCWGKHTCHMGVVKALKALSAVPRNERSREADKAIAAGSEYILAHHVFKQSHDLSKTSKPGWRRLQFPLMYQTDVLEIVNILGDLGVRDNRMQEAIDLVASKQGKNGKWVLENTFNGRYQVNIEAKDRPSKWITYKSLKALKDYYGG